MVQEADAFRHLPKGVALPPLVEISSEVGRPVIVVAIPLGQVASLVHVCWHSSP